MKLNILSTAIAAALVSSFAIQTAQAAPANASAEGLVEISNFKFSTDNGGVPGTQLNWGSSTSPGASASNISTTETDTANSITHTINTPAFPGASVSQSVTSGTYQAPLDSTGPAAGTAVHDNMTAPTALLVANLPVLSGQFAAAASNESGSPILNTPSGPNNATTGANGSMLYSASYAVANAAGTETSNQHSDITVKATLTGVSGQLDFSGQIGAYAAAFLSAGNGLSAYADYTFALSLKDVTTGAQVVLTPTINVAQTEQALQLNNVSDGAPGAGSTQSVSITGYNSGTGALNQLGFDFETAGSILNGVYSATTINSTDKYQLTASIHTDANVELAAVPEPAMLALLGIGLLGMGAASRKATKANTLLSA